MAIEQNGDAVWVASRTLWRERSAIVPYFFWKNFGTNPRFDCFGLDGAERFRDKTALQRPVQPQKFFSQSTARF
jgi:hypothetical protein